MFSTTHAESQTRAVFRKIAKDDVKNNNWKRNRKTVKRRELVKLVEILIFFVFVNRTSTDTWFTRTRHITQDYYRPEKTGGTRVQILFLNRLYRLYVIVRNERFGARSHGPKESEENNCCAREYTKHNHHNNVDNK